MDGREVGSRARRQEDVGIQAMAERVQVGCFNLKVSRASWSIE